MKTRHVALALLFSVACTSTNSSETMGSGTATTTTGATGTLPSDGGAISITGGTAPTGGKGGSAVPTAGMNNTGDAATGGAAITTLATGLNSPYSLKVDAMNVYFINAVTAANNYADGALMKVPVAGGNTTTIVSGQTCPTSIAITGTNLYWTNNGSWISGLTDYTLNTVMAIPIGGGKPLTLASGQDGPTGIVVDATNVYWTNNTVLGTVMKMPLGGGTPTVLASELYFSGSIAVDANNVYWLDQGPRKTPTSSSRSLSRLMTVPIKGGTPIMLASASPGAYGSLATDANNVYWVYSIYYADNAAPGDIPTPDGGVAGCVGTVEKVPIAGGTPAVLASGQFCHSGEIAVDATAIYWMTSGTQASSYTDGAVMAQPLAGGTPIAVAAMQRTSGGLAIDDTSVYWTVGGATDGDGAVLKAPKLSPQP